MPAAPESRVYVLTVKGNAELMNASTALTPEELKLLVLVDGMASVGAIAGNPQNALDAGAVAAALEKLARSGLVSDPDGSASINIRDFSGETDAGLTLLQANGFFVRIARRAPARKLAPGQKITVLAIEDDPQLAKLLRMYLQMEDFVVRIAATRDEINKALREPPKPDIVLLDVELPDSNGFEVLEKMRGHEFSKSVPIIMATARASREAVLKGLRGGAYGYVTKPFDMEVVSKALKAVLGLPH